MRKASCAWVATRSISAAKQVIRRDLEGYSSTHLFGCEERNGRRICGKRGSKEGNMSDWHVGMTVLLPFHPYT